MISLFVKIHNKTGLKYFGKTIHNPLTYTGSGKYWKRHLRKHGTDLSTKIIGEFDSIRQASKVAMKFSIDNNIVESKDWANFRFENATDGAPPGNVHKPSTKRKISKALMGRRLPKSKYVMRESKETRSKRSHTLVSNSVWITNGKLDRRIHKDSRVPKGWRRGRNYVSPSAIKYFMSRK